LQKRTGLQLLAGRADVARTNFENLRVYQLAENLADEVWKTVLGWDNLARDTTGKQLIRAADSIGTNIAEGSGRGTYKENRHFVRIARGSLNETQHWLRRAYQRNLLHGDCVTLLKSILDELSPRPNAYLKSIGTCK
jgi:four helix bundle protein